MRPTRRPLLIRTLSPLALGGLLLAGCSGTPGDADETPTTEATASPEEEMAEEPSPTETEGTDDSASASGGPECLEGDWTADLDSTEEFKLAAPGIRDLDPRVEVTGESTVSFDGSTMTTEYMDQVTEMTLTVVGSDIVVTTTVDGTVSASYQATDTEITVDEADLEGLTVESTATLDGAETDLPPIDDAEMFGIDLTGVSQYTCDEETLELEPEIDGVDDVRQVLTRE